MGTQETFVRRLRVLMEESHYSQRQIAQLCNTTEASLSRYMNGERMPKPEILANLATALNTTTDYLLGKEDQFADYSEIKALVARSKKQMTIEQRKELSKLLLDVIDNYNQENI